MVTHYSTILPLPCLSMQERTGLRVFTELWAYVPVSRWREIIPTVWPEWSTYTTTAAIPTEALRVLAATPGAALTRTSRGVLSSRPSRPAPRAAVDATPSGAIAPLLAAPLDTLHNTSHNTTPPPTASEPSTRRMMGVL